MNRQRRLASALLLLIGILLAGCDGRRMPMPPGR